MYFLPTALLLISHYIPQSYSADFWSALIRFSPNFNLASTSASSSPHIYMYAYLYMVHVEVNFNKSTQ